MDRETVSPSLSALAILRDAAGEVNRLSPENTLADALRLMVDTAVRLVGRSPEDEPSAEVYVYDSESAAFLSTLGVTAGRHADPALEGSPRPDGLGATALRRRKRILSYGEPNIPLHPANTAAGTRTVACYPLLVTGKPTGVLYIGLKTERRFSEEELLLLDMLAHQAAAAIHNTQRFEGINRTLQRKVDELERLRRAERLISSRPNLEDTLREILRIALDLTRAGHGSFRLLDKRRGILRLVALSSGEDGGPWSDGGIPVDDTFSVVGWVAARRQPARIADLREPPWSGIYRPLHSKGSMLSELAMPLLGAGGGLEGVLNLESPQRAAFDEEDQRLLEALATQAVIAVQEAKLLDALDDVSSRMLTQPLDDLLAFIIDRACDLINAPHGAMWVLPSDRPDTLVVRAASAGHTPGETLPLEGSLIGTALRERTTVISEDVRDDTRFLRRDLARRMGWVSGLIVPLLMRDGTPRGALTLYTDEPRSFSAWDTRLLIWLANHTAVAVQDAETLEQLAQARERQATAETFAALGDVSANLLHRVNNLVGIIPVRVQGVLDKRPAAREDPYTAAALAEIEQSARSAMMVAREAMAYLRPLRLQPTRVEPCFHAARERLALPQDLRIEVSGLDSLPPVLAGEEQLRLVFFNLLENAMDAILGFSGSGDSADSHPAPAGRAPRIEVRGMVVAEPLRGRPSQVEITLADNGPGVPPEKRDHVFDPTYSSKRSPRKLGFGLWWVKTLVNRFGGEIRIQDRDEPGCAFVMRLPCSDDSAAAGEGTISPSDRNPTV